MITQPIPGLLIRRVCDVLEAAMLDLADPARAQRQTKAALWSLRRIAQGLEGRDERLRADIADMERVLAAHRACRPPDDEPPAESTDARHRQLQARVAALEADVHRAGSAASPHADAIAQELRALYRRMLEREAGAP